MNKLEREVLFKVWTFIRDCKETPEQRAAQDALGRILKQDYLRRQEGKARNGL